jgi:hypothetical protein
VSAESALYLSDDDITLDVIKNANVKAENLAMAGIGPRRLKVMGISSMSGMLELGFDSLYLVDPKFVSECVTAFGAKNVLTTIVTTASDAVSVAGTDAITTLGLTTDGLLRLCVGAPLEAKAVLEQMPRGASLFGVNPDTLLDTGIRKGALQDVGYGLAAVAEQTSASAVHLQKLGFSFVI